MALSSQTQILDLREILEWSDLVLSSIGLLLNLLLLILIVKKTSPHFKDYQKLLLQSCITDLVYNICHFAARPQVDFKSGNSFVLITNAYGKVPLPYNAILACLYLYAFFLCVCTLPVQFLYRYNLIVKGVKERTGKYILKLIANIFLPFIYFLLSLYSMWPKLPEYYEKAKLLEEDAFYYKEIPNYITSDIHDWSPLAATAYASLLTVVSYGIVFWTSFKVWSHLKEMKSHMSAQTKDIHRQMTLALVIQAALPLLIFMFPVSVTVSMLLLQGQINGLGIAISMLLPWIPILNSLTTIFIIKSYRKAVINTFLWITKKKESVSVVSVI